MFDLIICHQTSSVSPPQAGLTNVLQAEEKPRCECDPDEEKNPNAASEEVVLVQNLRQRAMLERQAHEEFEGHRETEPDEANEKGLVA